MKTFNYKVVLSFILLIINGVALCQTDTTANFESSRESNKIGKYKLRLDGYQKYQSPLLSLRTKVNIDLHTDFIIPALNQNVLEENLSRLKLREEINSAMVIYREGLYKNDLGVFGEILGYTNAAAAIGLAIYHVAKYKKEYGIK
jgi:hypothetical protein